MSQSKVSTEVFNFLVKYSNSASDNDFSIAGFLLHGRRYGNVVASVMDRVAAGNVSDQIYKFPLALHFNGTNNRQAVDLTKEVFIITPEEYTGDV